MPTELLAAPPAEHPVYAGHFPGSPITPGAMLLDSVVHAVCLGCGLDESAWHVASVKFFSPVVPGETLELRQDSTNSGFVTFSLHAGTRVVARGRLRVADGSVR